MVRERAKNTQTVKSIVIIISEHSRSWKKVAVK